MKTLYVPLDSVAVALGADELVTALKAEAARSGTEIRIVRNGSRGMHWLEPLVEVEVDGIRHGYGPVQADDVPSVWAAGLLTASPHPLALGPIEDHDFLKRQTRLTFARCGRIDPLSLSDYAAQGGWLGLRKALTLTDAAIRGELQTSGLRGRGGAGFPAAIKWQTVADTASPQKYIVCNADEGDSGTFADRMILEGDPLSLIEGMIIAGLAVGATRGFVYLRSEYPIAKTVFAQALELARAGGWLGDSVAGSGKSFDIELFIGAGAYICGEESSLLNSLEGKRGEVRARPPLPAQQGLFNQPTLVHNVLSLCAVPTILEKGGAFYRDFGVGRSRGTLPFQLAGNVRHGGLVELAFGVTLRELVVDFAGGTRSGLPIRAVQIGGPLGAYLPTRLLDLPMDYEVLAAQDAGVGHGGVVVFDSSVDLATQAAYAFAFCAAESCGKCTPCRIGAVRGVEVMDQVQQGIDHSQNLELLNDLCDVMVSGSLCAMGGMTPVPVRSALRHFPEDFGL